MVFALFCINYEKDSISKRVCIDSAGDLVIASGLGTWDILGHCGGKYKR